ncbi:type IV pilus secretin PilQ [Lampropedia puyangensis]|uniref:Type IV pilus secretin PilQ n=1 Tax=Lampropedia puyangensis TaxID=1330072 RepID=A0A4S8F0B7_9BURK|nr:type IV pilus secretin PilQ [Lampropedia puyangensis]THU00680.1 type IV pilus secretin PilQ [Lampropedia puyangensis]
MCEKKLTKYTPLIKTLIFVGCVSSVLNAFAVDIVSVSGAQRDGRELVQIQLDQPIDFDPVAFVVQSPARISLDFPSVNVKSGRQNVEVNQGNLRSIHAIESGDRSRVVLNLRETATYQIQRSGNTVSVLLNSNSVGHSVASKSLGVGHSDKLQSVQSAQNSLQNLDFRKGVDGAGRVILSMPGDASDVDLRQEGRKIVLEIPNSTLSAALRNRLDVTDFGTPVQFLQARQVGNSTLVEVEVSGDWTQSAYQADGQYVLEVRKVEPDPTKLTQGVGFSGEKLSLNFQNIEIRSLLQVIADFTNFNIVTSDSVQGSLTLRLQDVPWDQALQIILDSKSLGYEKNGNVLWVAPKDELDARRQKDFEAKLALEKLEPLRTQIFQLNYARSEYIAEQLISSNSSGSTDQRNNRFLTERGSAIAEKRTNQLFVTDTPSRLEEVARLIASWDIPVRQVLIEARIVEATDNFGRNLGVRLGGNDLRAERGGEGGYNIGGDNRVVIGGNYGNVLTSSGAGSGSSSSGQFFNFGASGIGNTAAASFALSIFNSAANRFLNLELSALESTGEGRVISSPRIVTADQVEAFIEQGTEIPYTSTAPNGATTVEFKKAVMRLGVTPQITPEGNVILDLEVNKDSPTISGDTVSIDTKKVTTQVLVENGGTVVIGGIFELIESTGETKVPFLGDLPIAGRLFKSTTRTTQKSELMVFITPKIVTDQNTMRR